MKILTSLLCLASIAMLSLSACASTQTATTDSATLTDSSGNPIVAEAQLSPAQIASLNTGIDNLLPYIPAADVPIVSKLIGVLGLLAVLGRFYEGYRTGGIPGILHALFTSRTPSGPAPAYLVKGDAALRVLLALGLLSFVCLGSGCMSGSVHHQYVQNESGTGLKTKIPIGYNGNNILELDLWLGTFKSTSLMQPVETNRVYSPALAVVATTRGNLKASALTTGTNGNETVTGGDSYVLLTGHTEAGATNNANIQAQTWQDAPGSPDLTQFYQLLAPTNQAAH